MLCCFILNKISLMKQTCNLQLASNFREPRYTQRRRERENKMHCKLEGFEEKKKNPLSQ